MTFILEFTSVIRFFITWGKEVKGFQFGPVSLMVYFKNFDEMVDEIKITAVQEYEKGDVGLFSDKYMEKIKEMEESE